MHPKLVNAIREQMRERANAARAGKACLIFFVSQASLQGCSVAQKQKLVRDLEQMAQTADYQAVSLQIEQRVFHSDSLPIDIDGPDTGWYLRFVWQLESSASIQPERVSQSAKACFDLAHIEAQDVTRDLERIFLMVYGD